MEGIAERQFKACSSFKLLVSIFFALSLCNATCSFLTFIFRPFFVGVSGVGVVGSGIPDKKHLTRIEICNLIVIKN